MTLKWRATFLSQPTHKASQRVSLSSSPLSFSSAPDELLPVPAPHRLLALAWGSGGFSSGGGCGSAGEVGLSLSLPLLLLDLRVRVSVSSLSSSPTLAGLDGNVWGKEGRPGGRDGQRAV